tara:strand:+ start:1157 stop:1531 length:375 start_codon:yes stop_codon:yes gene_type:complete
MLKEIIAVFIGGGIGSVLRFMVNKIEFISENNIPYPTLISNILGCFILGLVLGYFLKNENPNSILFVFLTVGICGGFTTFSSFSYENLELLENGQIFTFLTYMFGSLVVGMISVYSGTYLFKTL